MGLIEKTAKRMAETEKITFIDDIRVGWNNYNFIFYIGGISAILGSQFGWAGWLSTIVTVGFFYYMGKFKKHLDTQRERVAKLRKKKVEDITNA